MNANPGPATNKSYQTNPFPSLKTLDTTQTLHIMWLAVFNNEKKNIILMFQYAYFHAIII